MAVSKKTDSIVRKVYELKAFCDEDGQLQDDAEKKALSVKKKIFGTIKDTAQEEEISILACASDYAQTVVDDLSSEAEDLAFQSLEEALSKAGYDTEALRLEGYVDFCMNEAADIAENCEWEDSAKQMKKLSTEIKKLPVAGRKAAEKYIEEYNAFILSLKEHYCADRKAGRRMWGNPEKEIRTYLWEAVTHALSGIKNGSVFADIFLAAYYNPEEKAVYMGDVFYDIREFTEDDIDLEFESGSSGKPVIDALALLSCQNPEFLQNTFDTLKKDDEKIAFLSLMPKVHVNSSRLAHFLANGKTVPAEIDAETYYVFNGHGLISESSHNSGLLTETKICQEGEWKSVLRMYTEDVNLSDWSSPDFMCGYFDGLIDSAVCEMQKRHRELLTFFDAAGPDEETKNVWLHILYQTYLSKTDDIFGRYKWYAQNAYVYTGDKMSREAAMERFAARFVEVKKEFDKLVK